MREGATEERGVREFTLVKMKLATDVQKRRLHCQRNVPLFERRTEKKIENADDGTLSLSSCTSLALVFSSYVQYVHIQTLDTTVRYVQEYSIMKQRRLFLLLSLSFPFQFFLSHTINGKRRQFWRGNGVARASDSELSRVHFIRKEIEKKSTKKKVVDGGRPSTRHVGEEGT